MTAPASLLAAASLRFLNSTLLTCLIVFQYLEFTLVRKKMIATMLTPTRVTPRMDNEEYFGELSGKK